MLTDNFIFSFDTYTALKVDIFGLFIILGGKKKFETDSKYGYWQGRARPTQKTAVL